VFDVEHEGTLRYAAKEYFNIDPEDIAKTFTELLGFQHENVVMYHNVYKRADSNCAVVFMDRIHQSLPAVVEDTSVNLSPQKTLLILRGIAQGLAYLHQKNIVHCDLIPPNILLTADLQAKISDYGNTRVMPINCACTQSLPEDHSLCDYLPPEAIEGEESTTKIDVFSFGQFIIYIILRQKPHPLKKPVFKQNGKQVARSEFERRERFTTEMSSVISGGILEPLWEWMKQCLNNNKHERPLITHFFSINFENDD
jgi:serine/threonine protein kinase